MKKLISICFLLKMAYLLTAQPDCVTGIMTSVFDNPPGCQVRTLPFETNNYQSTVDTFDFEFACGKIENSSWFSVLANSDGQANFLIAIISCLGDKEGIEAGLYDLNLNKVGGCSTINGTSCLVVQFRDLIPGEAYYLMLDGLEGARCKFAMRNNSLLPDNLSISREQFPLGSDLCPGAEVCFWVPPIRDSFGVKEYDWSISPRATIVSGGGMNDDSVCYRLEHPAFYGIELGINYNCFRWKFLRTTLSVFHRDRVANQRERICEGGSIFVDSIEFTETGIYEIRIPDLFPIKCDSSHILDLTVVDTSAPVIRCHKDTFIDLIGITWTKNPEVLGYDLNINDSIINLDNQFTYLYDLSSPVDTLNISLTPFSDLCNHAIGYAQCIDGKTSKVSDKKLTSELNLFPNPTNNSIKIKSEIPIENIEIFDFSGRKILIDDFSKVDLSNEPSGIYIFKIKTQNGVVVKKIFKN